MPLTLPHSDTPVLAGSPLAADEITKRFGGQTVLDRCTLAVPPGAIVGLLGENGSGKTTLIQTLVGLLRPTQGQATLLGQLSTKLTAETKEQLGYVPQETQLPTWMRVGDLFAYYGSFYARWDEAHVAALCDRWRLDRAQRFGDLSGGQQQLASLVVALGHRPRLLVLDEPVANLDPKARRDFLTLLHELADDAEQAGRDLTVLFSTHLLSDLERTATHVAFMKQGQIAVFRELESLKESVVRLRITSAQPLPAPRYHALDIEQTDCTIVALVDEHRTDDWTDWAAEHDATVLTDRLSLEDLFVALTASA